VCVTGPRQSGKTTLARATFGDKPYLSLEDPDIARLASDDPRGLLENYRDGLILDEVQTVPEILTYLKTAVDADPQPGKYIVTGSRQFDLLAGVSESLAGRAAFVSLLPFSAEELKGAGQLLSDPFAAIQRGFYPPMYDRDISPYDWYTNYIASYVERDVRSILNVKDLGLFQTFVKMCAARIGQILNVNALALDCGLSHNTARAWLSVLETSGIVYLLKPYHRNFGKRLTKSPKLYFIDTGLACRIIGIRTAEELFIHPHRGNIFESFVVSELLKKRNNQGHESDLYYWRDNVGTEVDIVYEDGLRVKGIEIKSGKTVALEFFKGLDMWMRYSGSKPEDCALIYAGNQELKWKGTQLVPWASAGEVLVS